MKKILIVALLCAICVNANAQWSTTGTVTSTSNTVGIGTNDPQGSLDIFSSVNTSTTPLFSLRSDFHTIGNYGMIRFGDYTQTSQYQKGAIIYESVAGSARGKFHIALENTDGTGSVSLSDARFMVLSSGNVGIGTTSPQGLLSMKGNSSFGMLRLTPISDNNEASISFNTHASETDLSNVWAVGSGGWGLGSKFAIGNNNGALMTLTTNGNVGIGTTDDSNWQLANSTYKLAVGGSVIATAVTVKLRSAWPDYVFMPKYTLMPLADVKSYIDKNHHLPDMPSAEKIEKDGLDVGEMNKLLLKKVEELTLYLMEQDKRIKILEAKLKD